MFALLGPILICTGLAEGTALNTQTGAAMLLFGATMLALGVGAQRRQKGPPAPPALDPADLVPEGLEPVPTAGAAAD